MPVSPLVIPARPETDFPEVRVSALSIQQTGVGQPVRVGYQIDRYRVAAGASEDAPAGTSVSGNVQIGMPALAADPALAAAVQAITEYAVAQAVAAGLLTATA